LIDFIYLLPLFIHFRPAAERHFERRDHENDNKNNDDDEAEQDKTNGG